MTEIIRTPRMISAKSVPSALRNHCQMMMRSAESVHRTIMMIGYLVPDLPPTENCAGPKLLAVLLRRSRVKGVGGDRSINQSVQQQQMIRHVAFFFSSTATVCLKTSLPANMPV